MTNVYYLSEYRSKVPESAAPLSRIALQQKLLREAESARLAMLEARARNQLTEQSPRSKSLPVNPEARAQLQLELQRLQNAEESQQRFREAMQRRMPPAPEVNELVSATPILLFHVSSGRNAWHSTWNARYQKGTLQSSREEAEKFVSRRLKQGTAFRLLVTPGWHLQFDRKAYLVCEINTKAPFSRLRAASFTVSGITEKEALAMLSPGSELWRGAAPQHDSVIVQETKAAATAFAPWTERTAHPYQIRTPGRYKRESDTSGIHFVPVSGAGQSEYNVRAFEALLTV